MDKVTQSNAANAEESAAAAQELNSQAESLEESVEELLHLVGGGGTGSPAAPVSPAQRNPGPLAPPRRDTSIRKNGHGHPAPATAKAANGRSEIPLEGDFRDF
jgi:methyl-accepting chemotaxis protein